MEGVGTYGRGGYLWKGWAPVEGCVPMGCRCTYAMGVYLCNGCVPMEEM